MKARYQEAALSMRKNEVWRNVNFEAFLKEELSLPDQAMPRRYDYQCNIPNLEAYRVAFVNGYATMPTFATEAGVICCSINEARRNHADLLRQLAAQVDTDGNPYLALNADAATDGLFLYVPDGVRLQRPVQLLSVANADTALMLHLRHVVALGRGSALTLIQCDDSHTDLAGFSNNVTLVSMDEESHLEHYKMQNLNDQTALLNQTFVTMRQGAELRSVGVTLNGGSIRNHNVVTMLGEHCNTEVHGLYLIDREQRCDNYVYVDHACPNCNSRELYKGILDDAAHGAFNGHVLVREGAVKTEAYQSNKNLLLTDKAFVQTKPFLEIYNDDVKCSHGSTIGQLDEQALFYIQQRGISLRNARTLLMYAFCDEVLQSIGIAALRERLADMVKKRLHGELTACSECALSCANTCGCTPPDFNIDPTKL